MTIEIQDMNIEKQEMKELKTTNSTLVLLKRLNIE